MAVDCAYRVITYHSRYDELAFLCAYVIGSYFTATYIYRSPKITRDIPEIISARNASNSFPLTERSRQSYIPNTPLLHRQHIITLSARPSTPGNASFFRYEWGRLPDKTGHEYFQLQQRNKSQTQNHLLTPVVCSSCSRSVGLPGRINPQSLNSPFQKRQPDTFPIRDQYFLRQTTLYGLL